MYTWKSSDTVAGPNPTDRFHSSDTVHESTSQLTQIVNAENVCKWFLLFFRMGTCTKCDSWTHCVAYIMKYIVGSQLQSSQFKLTISARH